MRYFVARVSTKEQNLARQLVVARERFEIPDENVFCDKASGKDFDRPEYKRMKSLLQRGDEVIVKEFDRLGRNKSEVKTELEWFKEHGVIVRILDIPTTLIDFKEQTWVLEMVNNILIEVMGTIAEQERKKILQRQAEGIAAAKARGVRFGRPPFPVPENFTDVCRSWSDKKLTLHKAAEACRMPVGTFYQKARKYLEATNA